MTFKGSRKIGYIIIVCHYNKNDEKKNCSKKVKIKTFKLIN